MFLGAKVAACPDSKEIVIPKTWTLTFSVFHSSVSVSIFNFFGIPCKFSYSA